MNDDEPNVHDDYNDSTQQEEDTEDDNDGTMLVCVYIYISIYIYIYIYMSVCAWSLFRRGWTSGSCCSRSRSAHE